MQTIFDTLGLSETKYLFKYEKYIDIPSLPLRVNKSLHEMKYSPHSIFVMRGKPLVLFFDKSIEKEKVFQQCWNFSESPIIIIENETDFELYNGFEYILNDETFLLNILPKDTLNYISLMSGQYIETIPFKNNDNRVDKKLLKNIKDARESLIYNLVSDEVKNKRKFEKKYKAYRYVNLTEIEIDEFQYKKNIANALIGRIIFIRYLIDRKVSIGFRKQNEKLSNDDLIEIIKNHETAYALFRYLKSDKGFNGDWFPLSKDEECIVEERHLKILVDLISGYDFKTKQGSLFNFYDFSIIPIEFISNVYESFIGEEEQSENGAYYTPTFLVDYILKYTVDDYFDKNPNLYNCKVLDPSCGSGIFLVEVLRKLISRFEFLHCRKITPKEIVTLTKENIYAIDYDRNAILISIFSLYLTMLDYQNPKDIEDFKFPYLIKGPRNESPNFFEDDFFDLEADFNNIISKKNINYIIGNPPYGRGTIKDASFANKYVLQNKFSIGNKDIVQPFMLRVKDFSSINTKISFIITSKVLYNLQSRAFRINHYVNNFIIEHVLELSSVRKEVFENADTPVSIIFYRVSDSPEAIHHNTIQYCSMKPSIYFSKLKILNLSKNDFKKVNQEKFLEYDYLWKILVYGSYLDFNFIKKLKTIYPTINTIAEEKGYSKGMGIQANSGQYDISHYINKDFIDIPRGSKSEKYMTSFYIAETLPKWTIKKVHRKGEESLFHKYSVLITRGVNTINLKAKAAILKKEALFKHTLTGINVPTEQIAQNFLGLINSSLFAYYNLIQATSIGIEREQLHDEEKLQVPFVESKEIISATSKIENIKINHLDRNSSEIFEYEKLLQESINNLDNVVLKEFNLNEQEIALIDYATNITIPWVIQKNFDIPFGKIEYKDARLEDYVNIFLNHYKKIYELNQMFFSVDILYHNYAIGIFFKVHNQQPDNDITWIMEENIQNFVKLSGRFSIENLFIQKDIKGFEKDYFYVIKPNEYKNWHKAIGYLDFYEFDSAILNAGKKYV